MISPVFVVNCIGQLNFQNPEDEVDLEQGPVSHSQCQKEYGSKGHGSIEGIPRKGQSQRVYWEAWHYSRVLFILTFTFSPPRFHHEKSHRYLTPYCPSLLYLRNPFLLYFFVSLYQNPQKSFLAQASLPHSQNTLEFIQALGTSFAPITIRS